MKLSLYRTEVTERGLGVTCPRKDCRGRFIVNEAKWRGPVPGSPRSREYAARPCPYCFRVSLLPPCHIE